MMAIGLSTGTTGIGTKWTGTATTSSGTLGAITMTNAGSLHHQPDAFGRAGHRSPGRRSAAARCPLTGYTVTNTMGVNTVAVKTPGSVSRDPFQPGYTTAGSLLGRDRADLERGMVRGGFIFPGQYRVHRSVRGRGGLALSLNLVAAVSWTTGNDGQCRDHCRRGTVGAVTQSEVALTPGSGATAADY